MKQYAVASTLIQEKPGVMNILTDIRPIEADSEAEAIGVYVLEVSKEFPEHNIHVRPVSLPSYNKE